MRALLRLATRSAWNRRLVLSLIASSMALSTLLLLGIERIRGVVWDHASTVAALNGAAVRMPGDVVPPETAHGSLKEFLLVPYFGACIHNPAPPANQIIDALLKTPAEGFRAMDTAWVSGRITTARQDSPMGASGDRIDAMAVERYVPPPKP